MLKNFFKSKNSIIETAQIDASAIKQVASAQIRLDKAVYEVEKETKNLTNSFQQKATELREDCNIEIKRIKADHKIELNKLQSNHDLEASQVEVKEKIMNELFDGKLKIAQQAHDAALAQLTLDYEGAEIKMKNGLAVKTQELELAFNQKKADLKASFDKQTQDLELAFNETKSKLDIETAELEITFKSKAADLDIEAAKTAHKQDVDAANREIELNRKVDALKNTLVKESAEAQAAHVEEMAALKLEKQTAEAEIAELISDAENKAALIVAEANNRFALATQKLADSQVTIDTLKAENLRINEAKDEEIKRLNTIISNLITLAKELKPNDAQVIVTQAPAPIVK